MCTCPSVSVNESNVTRTPTRLNTVRLGLKTKLMLGFQMNQPQIGRGWSRSGQLCHRMAATARSQPAWGDKWNNLAFHTGLCKPAGGMACFWLTSGIQSNSWFRFGWTFSVFSFYFPLVVSHSYHLGYFVIYYQSLLPVYSSITHVLVALIIATLRRKHSWITFRKIENYSFTSLKISCLRSPFDGIYLWPLPCCWHRLTACLAAHQHWIQTPLPCWNRKCDWQANRLSRLGESQERRWPS